MNCRKVRKAPSTRSALGAPLLRESSLQGLSHHGAPAPVLQLWTFMTERTKSHTTAQMHLCSGDWMTAPAAVITYSKGATKPCARQSSLETCISHLYKLSTAPTAMARRVVMQRHAASCQRWYVYCRADLTHRMQIKRACAPMLLCIMLPTLEQLWPILCRLMYAVKVCCLCGRPHLPTACCKHCMNQTQHIAIAHTKLAKLSDLFRGAARINAFF